MAFPQVATTNTSSEDSNTQSHSVSLPASISAGDLLLVFFVSDSVESISWPVGWNEIFDDSSGGAYTCTLAVAWRKADGNESSTITVTTGSDETSAHISFRITGAIDPTTTPPDVSVNAGGTDDSPNPASLTASDGSQEYLWIAVEGNDDDDTTTGYPSNYGDNQTTKVSGSSSGPNIAVATRENETETEDAGAFSLSAAEQWHAITLAIHPAGEAPSGTNTQINIGDTWKSIAGMQVNIGDSWKAVAGAKVNIGDSWKEVF